MSRPRRRDLGLSSREYEEAIVLERIFQLVKRNRCSTCLVRKCSHVDPDRYKLLCSSCASRCPFKIHIGTDHLTMGVLEKLESIYGQSKAHKLPSNSKSQGRKSSHHRRHHHRDSSRHTVNKKPLYSVSTEDSSHRRPAARNNKSHGHRRPISSSSSFDGRRSKRYDNYDQVKTIAPIYSSSRDFDEKHAHRPRKDNYAQVRPDYHSSSAIYGSPDPYYAEYPGNVSKSFQRKDPYGYELPVTDDMPGMVGIMAGDKPGRRHRLADNGWPVIEPSTHREMDRRLVNHEHRYLPIANGRPGVRPESTMEVHPLMKGYGSSNNKREGRSNPFAKEDSLIINDNMNRTRISADDVDRFNMSSMRMALQPNIGPQPCSLIDTYQGFEAPMGNGGRYVADYGGLYDRRGRR